MSYVLEHGGDVELKGRNETLVFDRIEITDGVAVCYNKKAYSKSVYPLSDFEAIHTHTSDDEENAEWW